MFFKKEAHAITSENTVDYKIKSVELGAEIEVKDIEIASLKKKLELRESELKESDYLSVKRLIEDKKKLEFEIDALNFNAKNNTENIELKTENAKIKSELEVAKSENSHLKTLIKTYQELPDIKRMIENLSSIAVPNIEELKSFASAVTEIGIKDLVRAVEENTSATKDIVSRSLRGYR